MKIKIMTAVAAACLLTGCGLFKSEPLTMVSVISADGHNEIRLFSAPLSYEVLRDGVVVVAKTEIGLNVDGKMLGKTEPIEGCMWFSDANSKVATAVYKKGAINDAKNGKRVSFGTFGVEIIARNDGVAYRFHTRSGDKIVDETANLTIPSKKARCWYNRTGSKAWGCEETVPEFADAGKLKTDAAKNIYMPFVYSVGGKTVAVSDSDVHGYPVWNFHDVDQSGEGVTLKSVFSKYPKATQRVGGWGSEKGLKTGGRWVQITETEDFLAKADGERNLPWRLFQLADQPSKLCESDLVYALATPVDPKADFSWVKPGKVAWDWWNCFDNAVKGAPNGGCTTKTYERFIDFAAKTGVEYVIFDEGWSAALNIWKFHPEVDVPHLIDYANKKGVGIILWMAWAQVYGEEEKVAEHFSKLGAKGFKVDFMDRGDAEVANFLEKFAAACAKHKMVIDYHGAYRPVGLNRTYPNVLNYEGIHGLEQMKWAPADKDMPYNDVACFFLRMSAGPMDYTPGAMLNFPYGKYTSGEGARLPGSVGTRCHQMAMMALYEAPLQMLSDSPTNYEKNMECFDFMSKTPVVWDDTVGLAGCPESMAVAARKAKDGSWYAAGLNNKTPKTAEFDTAFLGAGEWKAEIFRDTDDAATEPMKFVHEKKTVKAGEKLSVKMGPGGGFIIKFTK